MKIKTSQSIALAVILVFLCLPAKAQDVISIVRQLPVGSQVTVQGLVLNDNALGSIRYIQDSTGGIGVFPGNGSVTGVGGASPGDRIQVTGTLSSYHGLLEINPVTSFILKSTGNPLPEPLPITLAELGPANEGQLVRITCISWPMESLFRAGETEVFDQQGTQSVVYLRSGHPVVGSLVPGMTLDIVGISSRFDLPQLLPRNLDDFSVTTCEYLTEHLSPIAIDRQGFTFTFASNVAATGGIRYRQPDSDFLEIRTAVKQRSHELQITGLLPATLYECQPFIDLGAERIYGSSSLWITESESSGNIEVYFNYGVDSSFASGWYPSGTTGSAMQARLLSLIQGATKTIDFCAYNINLDWIVQALNEAVQRGVIVRYVGNAGTSNTSLDEELDFPVSLVNPSELMHNKFIVVDADIPGQSIVWTGSVNFTGEQMLVDPNDCLLIHDQSLARVYTIEFNELWGGAANLPGSGSLYGSKKLDNTPHWINIQGTWCESYFSPSDHTTAAIIRAINTVDHTLSFGVLSFTRDDIADAVIAQFQQGRDVRGIMENIDDQGSEWNRLVQSGIAMHAFPDKALFHHKLGIIDYENPESDPLVITGSHNWTTAAERDNDENLLIIHSSPLANIYNQAFNAIYSQSTSIRPVVGPERISLLFYPNPAVDLLHVRMADEKSFSIGQLLDAQGRVIQAIINPQPTSEMDVQIGQLRPGVYFFRVIQEGISFTKRWIKL